MTKFRSRHYQCWSCVKPLAQFIALRLITFCPEGRQPHSADPCYQHDVLSCGDQSIHFHNRSVVKCDRRTGWFRFLGDAGTQMATSCVPLHHCGTQATGWLDGQHPTSPGEEVSARVCYHWDNNCCKFEARALVRDCEGFFVYKLLDPPKLCAARACSVGEDPSVGISTLG